jgi:carbon monoxide dehydrogenase subunit G
VKLDGRIEIDAPAAAVWDVLIDPVSLAGCVPGVERVSRLDERTFEGAIRAAIGPLESAFTFTSTIERSAFPDDLEVVTIGTDSMTRSEVRATVRARLEPAASGATALAYDADVSVGGRLAIIGEMILRATAGVLIGEVARCLRARLEGPAGDKADGGARPTGSRRA